MAKMSASKVELLRNDLPTIRNAASSNHAAHVVQFYREDRSLIETLNLYIGSALSNGDSAIMVATQAHCDALIRELQPRIDVTAVLEQGRFQWLELSEILLQIMADGMPDASRFNEVMGGIIEQARLAAKREQPQVAIFGEMVAFLWAEGKHDAAIRLEELWNELAKSHSFSLRCAYPMTGFSKKEQEEPFLKICSAHSDVIPDESYGVFLTDEQRLRSVAALQQKLETYEKQRLLQESEQQLRLLVDAVQDYAIFMLDAEGRVQTWNAGAQRINGYKAAEIIGRHFSCFYSEEDLTDGKPERELKIAVAEGRVEDEGWRLRKDGTKFWASVTITVLKDPDGRIVGFSKVTRDSTDRMLAQRALEESRQRLQDSEKSLRQLSRHLLRTQDEERRRIGRDLHDSLGQSLAMLKMKLDSLVIKNNGSETADARDLKQCAQLTEDAVKEIRTISYLLYPPMLEEMGLRSAILWYLDGFMKRSGVKTVFTVAPDFKRLPSDIELAIFRVLQESLTNVHRHSGSPTADVRLWVEDDTVCLEVSDKGKGMNTGSLEGPGRDFTGALGVGLRGMSERMRQLGGKLELSSTANGTVVSAAVPIPQASEARSSD